jgi:hypothetical protein
MTITKHYLKSSEGAIATYDYFDIAEGTGMKKFYGLSAKTSGSTTYALSTEAVLSAAGNITNDTTEESKSSADTGSAAYAEASEWDFDLAAFNLPKIIKGTAIINYSILARETDASQAFGYFKFKLIRDSGGTETIMGSTESQIVDAADTTYPEKLSGCVKIALTQTHFKKGDILRLTVEAWMSHQSGGNNTFLHLPHSPQNRNTTNFTATANQSKLEAYVPFQLDL